MAATFVVVVLSIYWLAKLRAAAVLAIPKTKEEKVAAAEANPDGVLVTESVAQDLFSYLQTQGRVTSFTSAEDVFMKLGTMMDRAWGTPEARRFQDDPGGGWLIDISKYVDGEALHTMIRTVEGHRMAVAVVEEEEIEAFLEGTPWVTEAAKGGPPRGVDVAALAMARDIENGKPTQALPGSTPAQPGVAPVTRLPMPAAPAAPVTQPDDPTMILVMESVPAEEGVPDAKILHHERCTREDVPGIVKMLLRRGPHGGDGPVSEEQIEVWSCVSRPKLEVTF